jgi:ABC-type nitrate/sulfonate/bicarbonate transport system substrate-binding protein
MSGMLRCVTSAIVATAWIVTAGSGARADIRFATGVDATFLTMVVAVEKGFMQKHGVKAEYKQFASGAVSLEAVVSGDADIAFASELAVLRPLSKGGKIVGLARGLYANELMGVAARKGIDGPKDLAGKAIGYAKGTASEYYLSLYANKYKIDVKSLRLVNVAAPEMVPALARGDIDVMFAWEPWFTRLRAVVPDARVIAKSGNDGVYTLQYIVMVLETALHTKRDEVANTVRALIEATNWLNDATNRSEAADILSRVYRIPRPDAERQLGEVVYVFDLAASFKDDIRKAADWMKTQGLIQVESTEKLVNDLLAPDILKSVAPDRVKS